MVVDPNVDGYSKAINNQTILKKSTKKQPNENQENLN